MPNLQQLTFKIKQNVYLNLIAKAAISRTGRKFLLNQFDKKIYRSVVKEGSKMFPRAVQVKKYK